MLYYLHLVILGKQHHRDAVGTETAPTSHIHCTIILKRHMMILKTTERKRKKRLWLVLTHRPLQTGFCVLPRLQVWVNAVENDEVCVYVCACWRDCARPVCPSPSAAAAASCGPHGSCALFTSSPAAVKSSSDKDRL